MVPAQAPRADETDTQTGGFASIQKKTQSKDGW